MALPRRIAAAYTLFAAVLSLSLASPACATDEIQVYDATINDPGKWSLQIHANYAIDGRTQPEFPGGIVPNHALQGTPELAYGVTDWWELGLYWPYALTNAGEWLDGGAKLRTLFVTPHARERTWVFGVNFELGYDNPQFAPQFWNLEIRPIIGYRNGPHQFFVNPILDIAFDNHDYHALPPDFAPAVRYAYAVSDTWTWGIEHYADVGPLDGNYPSDQQAHTTYAIVEWSRDPWDLHFGIGHGWTSASDQTIAKTIIGIAF